MHFQYSPHLEKTLNIVVLEYIIWSLSLISSEIILFRVLNPLPSGFFLLPSLLSSFTFSLIFLFLSTTSGTMLSKPGCDFTQIDKKSHYVCFCHASNRLKLVRPSSSQPSMASSIPATPTQLWAP